MSEIRSRRGAQLGVPGLDRGVLVDRVVRLVRRGVARGRDPARRVGHADDVGEPDLGRVDRGLGALGQRHDAVDPDRLGVEPGVRQRGAEADAQGAGVEVVPLVQRPRVDREEAPVLAQVEQLERVDVAVGAVHAAVAQGDDDAGEVDADRAQHDARRQEPGHVRPEPADRPQRAHVVDDQADDGGREAPHRSAECFQPPNGESLADHGALLLSLTVTGTLLVDLAVGAGSRSASGGRAGACAGR